MKPRVIVYLELLDRVESGKGIMWPDWVDEGLVAAVKPKGAAETK